MTTNNRPRSSTGSRTSRRWVSRLRRENYRGTLSKPAKASADNTAIVEELTKENRTLKEGVLRARFRKGYDKMELLKANEAYEFEIDMRGTANVFLPGHRVRVDVTSSNFPQFDRNPNSGEDLATGTKVRAARQTVFHSADRASHILLPVVDVPAGAEPRLK